MNCHFDSTENPELRAKIDDAKSLLPMPQLLEKLGLGAHAKKSARCPWHKDEHPSFSVFQKSGGTWWHRCFVGCSQGDEIAFLVKHFSISRREAIKRFLEMAGFPTRSPKSREYPKSRESGEYPKLPKSPKSPEYPEYPVSKGQGLEKELKDLAARNACTERSTARKRRWQLLRDLRAVQERIARKLTTVELVQVFDEWYRASLPLRDHVCRPGKTNDALETKHLETMSKHCSRCFGRKPLSPIFLR
jgi:CHC2-type zinc finger protein